ncbi:MAG: S8 family serine peptidase [Zetaproteobacteria bacterium]|nr:S8 family serine peptidase [Zetaproteobacteria bacterium]
MLPSIKAISLSLSFATSLPLHLSHHSRWNPATCIREQSHTPQVRLPPYACTPDHSSTANQPATRFWAAVAAGAMIGLTNFGTPTDGATLIAVVDTGVDIKHERLFTHGVQAWCSNSENHICPDISSNLIKPDQPNYNPKVESLYDEDFPRFLALRKRHKSDPLTGEENNWLIQKMQTPGFTKRLDEYLQASHGTHVAGIIAEADPQLALFPIRLIPDLFELPQPSTTATQQPNILKTQLSPQERIHLTQILREKLQQYAQRNASLTEEMAKLLEAKHISVFNGSYGVNLSKALVQRLMEQYHLHDTELANELFHELQHIYLQHYQSLMQQNPWCLFVFAAGNSHQNVDDDVHIPISATAKNMLRVAAWDEQKQSLAGFSNFGTGVDLAAPGVDIESSVPHNHTLPMSGTSQAAPTVSGIAGKIRDLCPQLSPQEVKHILLATVDHKQSLQGVVASGGVLNPTRALSTAQLIRGGHTITQALAIVLE